MLTTCTMTGVDQSTDINRLIYLSAKHSAAEWGVLLSLTRQGRENRYPQTDFIRNFAETCNQSEIPVQTALHFCGSSVMGFVNGDNGLRELGSLFGRIQLNFNARRDRKITAELVDAAVNAADCPVIIQVHDGNKELNAQLRAPGRQFLFDASGGRGERGGDWPAPVHDAPCGYAGGISPETITSDIARAEEASDGADHWIDMEGRIRTQDDLFDLDACSSVLNAVRAHHFPPTRSV